MQLFLHTEKYNSGLAIFANLNDHSVCFVSHVQQFTFSND